MERNVTLHIADATRDHVGPLLDFVSDQLSLIYTDKDPDFIIHSCFGKTALKYDGVRIAVLGENLLPDFNISDYAFGFARMSFGDRYCRLPLYRLYRTQYAELAECAPPQPDESVYEKARFCTCVVSNAGRDPFFFQVHDALCRYKPVDSGGRWRNTVGGPVVNKQEFLRTGKFSLVFENSSSPGYVTEKILQAFLAKTIPIYWGAPDIGLDFNPRAIINCHEYSSIDALLARIVSVDQDKELYRAILNEPCFPDNREPLELQKDYITNVLLTILSQPRTLAYRRNRTFWGNRYEREQRNAFFRPHIQGMRLIKQSFDRFRGRRPKNC